MTNNNKSDTSQTALTDKSGESASTEQEEILHLKYKFFQCRLYLIEQSNQLDKQHTKINGGKSIEHVLKALRFFDILDTSNDVTNIEAFMAAEGKTNGTLEIIPTLSVPRSF